MEQIVAEEEFMHMAAAADLFLDTPRCSSSYFTSSPPHDFQATLTQLLPTPSGLRLRFSPSPSSALSLALAALCPSQQGRKPLLSLVRKSGQRERVQEEQQQQQQQGGRAEERGGEGGEGGGG